MAPLTRRHFIGAGGLALGGSLIGLAGCGNNGAGTSGKSGGGRANLQFAWWGNPERDKRTKEALAAYQGAHKSVTVRPQITVWDGYWDKLATQTAGGSPPDLIQMDYAYITSYSTRGALLALDDYAPKTLRISDFGDEALSPGKVDGKLYGVNMGINSWAMMANKNVITKAGAELPDDSMTWSDFAELTKKIGKTSPDGVFGTQNGMFDDSNNPLECWLRQRGKALYIEDGKKLGFGPDDLMEWFEFWEELVTDGAAATPEVQEASSGDLADGLVPTDKAAFQFAWSNQLTAFVQASKSEIDIHMYPQGDGSSAKPGQYYKASMFLSVSSHSENPDAAVQLANALLTDPTVAGKLGFERGYPPSPKVRAALLPDASAAEKASGDYVEGLKDKIGETPPPPPTATEEVRQAMTYAYQQAGYKKTSNQKAIDRFFHDAEQALA